MYYVVSITQGIDTRVYAGDYSGPANAVFGAMRFHENEVHREAREGLDLTWNNGWNNQADRQEFFRRRKIIDESYKGTIDISVFPSKIKRPKKVHRVA